MKLGLIVYYAAQLASIIPTLVICLAAPRDYFVIRVSDEATGRGVRLIELKLTNEVKYWALRTGGARAGRLKTKGKRCAVNRG